MLLRGCGWWLSLWSRIRGVRRLLDRGLVFVVIAVLLGHETPYPLDRPVEALHGVLESS